jgi:hypothetical protein
MSSLRPSLGRLDSNLRYAQIAQLVEQWTENPRVAGSIPALGTKTEVKGQKPEIGREGAFRQFLIPISDVCLAASKVRV